MGASVALKAKKTLEDHKKELSLRNMRFNRFILQRYSLALFFFANLYWFIFNVVSGSWVVVMPLAFLIFAVVVMFEHYYLYHNHHNQLKWSMRFFIAQIVMNLILLGMSIFESAFDLVFPFFAFSSNTQLLVTAILVVGILIAGFNIHQLLKIQDNTDRKYQLIKKYEKLNQ